MSSSSSSGCTGEVRSTSPVISALPEKYSAAAPPTRMGRGSPRRCSASLSRASRRRAVRSSGRQGAVSSGMADCRRDGRLGQGGVAGYLGWSFTHSTRNRASPSRASCRSRSLRTLKPSTVHAGALSSASTTCSALIATTHSPSAACGQNGNGRQGGGLRVDCCSDVIGRRREDGPGWQSRFGERKRRRCETGRRCSLNTLPRQNRADVELAGKFRALPSLDHVASA